MENKPNIIVMGGSFNPPTIAHLKLIQAAMNAMCAERGYLVPVSHAYLKRKMVCAGCGNLCIPTEIRLQMLRAMTAQDTRVQIYEGEIHEAFAITTRTMELIQEKHPNARLWFVAGEDKLDLIASLTNKYQFLPRFGVVVFARGGNVERLIAQQPELSRCREAISIIEPPAGVEDVSSTRIREHLFDVDLVADMLHPDVVPLVRTLNPTDFPEEICQFKEEYAFLSNDYPAAVTYEGITYPCAASAFLGTKCNTPAERNAIARMSPEKAKQKYNAQPGAAEWEQHKTTIMEEIVRLKFEQHPELMESLLATGDRKLINGGKKDTFWGVNVVAWEGENRLGTILMHLRDIWREGTS